MRCAARLVLVVVGVAAAATSVGVAVAGAPALRHRSLGSRPPSRGVRADRRAPALRLSARARVRVVLPRGWHLVRARLTPVMDPAPVLAAATFPARSARHLCVCDTPNLRDFPRAGAFVFMWEYLERVSPSRLRRMAPPRPARFSLAGARPQTHMCMGPSYGTGFRAAGHAFQLEVYLGPAAAPRIRRQAESLLDSMRIGP